MSIASIFNDRGAGRFGRDLRTAENTAGRQAVERALLDAGVSLPTASGSGVLRMPDGSIALEEDRSPHKGALQLAAEGWAKSPANPVVYRAQRRADAEREARAAADPRAGGAGQAAARSFATRALDTAAAPVTLSARALRAAGVPGLDTVAELDANRAYADLESLLRDEGLADTRERHRVTAEAHPLVTDFAGNLGDAVGGGAGTRGARALGMARTKSAPVTSEQIAEALKKQSSGMREESFRHLRAGGEVRGGPPTIARYPGEEPYIVDGRHRLTLAAERGERAVTGDYIEYGSRGGVKRHLRGVELPTGVSGGTRPALDFAGRGAFGGGLQLGDAVSAERERAYLEGREFTDQDAARAIAQQAVVGGAMGAAMGVARRLPKPPPTKPAGPLHYDEAALQDEAPKVLGTKLDDAQATRLVGSHPELPGLSYYVSRGDAPGEVRIDMSQRHAQVSRVYRRDGQDLVVNHEVMRLDEPIRGKGVGKSLLRQQVQEYDRLGVARIELLAAKDGRSVWPWMGFELQNPADFARVRAAFDGWLTARGMNPSEFPASTVSELARIPQVGREFLSSPDAPQMRLSADMRGPVGDNLRRYLGVGGSSSRAKSKSKTSSASSAARSSSPSLSPSARGSSGGILGILAGSGQGATQ